MAIQKINLGTEPLGEGGDTYRSANTKINENFSDTTHAASRLVGTGDGQVATWKSGNIEGTKKDNRTNFLLKSGDSVPTNSAASRLVGKNDGDLVEMQIGGTAGSTVTPTVAGTGWGGTQGEVFSYSGLDITDDYIRRNLPKVSRIFYTNIPKTAIPTKTLRYSPSLQLSTGATNALLCLGTSGSGITVQTWNDQFGDVSEYVVYTDKNTNKGTNGALSAKSPVTHLYHDRVEHTGDDKELQPIEFVKQGLGNYLLKNTTGLAQEGWYIVIPQDANGNPLIAVEYEDNAGDISIRTYKRKFDYEQAKVVADHDNPIDIPETRWIDLRFNDDPSLYDGEQLDDTAPVEELIVDEVEDSEVVEKKPSENPVEEEK